MAVKKDIDTLIKEHLDQAKKLKEKKFQSRFKNILNDLRKFQDKISDEDIEKLHHTLVNRYGVKKEENQEINQEEIKENI
jgi:galactokinase/mevalonate kinase-like predicted kinase